MARVMEKKSAGQGRAGQGKKTNIFRPSLFWDVDIKNLDTKKHAIYIIERIIDFGNDDEVRWMWKNYPRILIEKVVKNSRVLHSSSRSLWTLLTKKKKR